MYFCGFFQTVWLLTGIPLTLGLFIKKITYNLSIWLPLYQYGYQFFILLFGRILPGVIISHHLKIRSLGLEKNLHIGMFTV